jgi:hypothetical protein
VASGEVGRMAKLRLVQPVRVDDDLELRASDPANMVGHTERGLCRGHDLQSAMPLAGERVRERHREAGGVGGGREFLGARRARPVCIASGPEQRQFAASAVLEAQTSGPAPQIAVPDDEGAAAEHLV